MNAGPGSGEVEGRRLCHCVAEEPLLGGPRCRGATSWTAPSLYGQDVDVPESDLYPAPRQSRPCVLSAFDAVKSIQPRGSSFHVSLSLVTQLLDHWQPFQPWGAGGL